MKRSRNRLFKSILWIIVFMVVMMCIVCFYDYIENGKGYRETMVTIQGSLHTLRVMNNYYSEALNTNDTTIRTQPNWKGFGLLKIHKAASTTTQTIFLRYGWTRKLTFVLPPEYNAFRYPNIISINESVTSYNILPPPHGKSFDILCHHVVYNKQAWDKILPKQSAKIGTVREPFDHFRSSVNYFNPNYLKSIKTENPVRTFLQNPRRYESRDLRISFTNNRMAFEFGVDPKIIQARDFSTFEKYLWDVLNEEFLIVLVAEKYDESLVVMRRKLDWKLQDILYVSHNVRSERTGDRYVITEEERGLHKHFAIFDYLIYNFFVKRLENDIANEIDFIEEVLNFKKVRQSVNDFCQTIHFWPTTILSIHASKWNEDFTINFEDCKLMYKGEIGFTQEIRRQQYGYSTWVWKRKNN